MPPEPGDPHAAARFKRARIRLRLDEYDIDGYVHVPPGGDPVARLNQDRHTFIALTSDDVFDANVLLQRLARELGARLSAAGFELAHLKTTLDSPDAGGQLAALSVTSGEGEDDLRESLLDGVRSGELILNLRAEGDPEQLLVLTRESIDHVVRTAISRGLDRLPESLREAVTLRDLQELEYEEISTMLSVPLGTVKSRINRGRIRLAELLTAERPELA